MKKNYFPLLCLLLFASCSPHLVTRGITDKTSNYIVTTSGKQINAPSVNIGKDAVSIDTTTLPIKNVSAIKSGHAYYGVQDGLLYNGIYYGKIMLLARYAGTSYDMTTHNSTPIYKYYLQKQGQSEIVDLTNRNLIEYVDDNALALRKAKAARIYANVGFVSCITAIAGLSCVFLPYSNRIRKSAVTVGLFSLPTFLICLPTASHKRYKTIIVYNR